MERIYWVLAALGILALAYGIYKKGLVPGLWLPDQLDGSGVEKPELLVVVGDEGKAVSRLNPIGRAEFNGNELEVTSRDGLLEAGTPVKVVRLEQGRVTVKPINNN